MEHIKAQPYKRAYVLRGIMVEVMNLQKHPDRLLKSRAVLLHKFYLCRNNVLVSCISG